MNAKKIASKLLLCFALISVGFVVGKEATLWRMRGTAPSDSGISGSGVMVYYMYPAIRCVMCNKIETAARDVVYKDNSQAVGDGQLKWREVNIADNDQLAEKYGVSSSMVVLVRFEDGKEVGFERLEKVWPLADKPDELSDYIRKSIAKALNGGEPT